jgi:hypothetical protein
VDWHTREICGFAIAEWAQEFTDLLQYLRTKKISLLSSVAYLYKYNSSLTVNCFNLMLFYVPVLSIYLFVLKDLSLIQINSFHNKEFFRRLDRHLLDREWRGPHTASRTCQFYQGGYVLCIVQYSDIYKKERTPLYERKRTRRKKNMTMTPIKCISKKINCNW